MRKEKEQLIPRKDPLCNTCSKAQIVRGFSESQVVTYCKNWFPIHRVAFLVSECTGYEDKRLPSLDSMEEIALILIRESSGRRMGFVTAERFRAIEGEDAEIIPSG